MQRISAAVLISAAAALAQGNFIHDGRSAWSLAYGLGPADGVTAHALGLAYSAKGMFDFGYSYVLMDYDENPLGLGNGWGLDAAFHILKGSGDNPFGMSIVAAFTHLDAGEEESGNQCIHPVRCGSRHPIERKGEVDPRSVVLAIPAGLEIQLQGNRHQPDAFSA